MRKPTAVHNRNALKPADIAMLGRVVDGACKSRNIDVDSAAGRDIASTLMALHAAGMVSEAALLDVVAFRRLD